MQTPRLYTYSLKMVIFLFYFKASYSTMENSFEIVLQKWLWRSLYSTRECKIVREQRTSQSFSRQLYWKAHWTLSRLCTFCPSRLRALGYENCVVRLHFLDESLSSRPNKHICECVFCSKCIFREIIHSSVRGAWRRCTSPVRLAS